MKEIEGAYVLSSKGALIFSQENLGEGTDFDLNYLSDFLSTIETIAMNVGEEEVKIIEFGNIKFYHARDKLTKIGFCFKVRKDIKQKKIYPMLSHFMNIFLERFTGNFTSPDVVKKQKMDDFIKSISDLLGEGKKVEYFLDEVKIG